MSFILVKPNRLINLDQIVDVEYTPAASGIDEDNGKPFSHLSELAIATTAVRAEKLTIWLRGEEADNVWAFFVNPNAQVHTSGHKPTIERNY